MAFECAKYQPKKPSGSGLKSALNRETLNMRIFSRDINGKCVGSQPEPDIRFAY